MQEYKSITISANDLPDELDHLYQKPSKLHARGNVQLLNKHPRVGIVGARKFTPYGRTITDEIATKLARSGVVVVSGLALGVDSIAHKSALDAGGQTIAVLPCGIETIYPSSHRGLGAQILQQNSLLISEYEGRELPMKHQFLERNRIIAALSDILVITEASSASGSLNTASHALEMGKTVMAVPGNITSPYSGGTNKLIQNGALAVLSADDILQALDLSAKDQLDYLPETETEKLILDTIKDGNNTVNDILRATGLPSTELQTTLTILEIKGVLNCTSSNWHIK